MNCILWGTGKYADILLEKVILKDNEIKIIAVYDNDCNKWGKKSYQGLMIKSPDMLIHEISYDYIIIAAAEWRTIRKQLINQYNVDGRKLENFYLKTRHKLLKWFEFNPDRKRTYREYFEWILNNPMDGWNHSFPDNYIDFSVEVFNDEDVSLNYSYYKGKKMYFPRDFSERNIRGYTKGLMIEQDENSPHKYMAEGIAVKSDDVVIDCGVAEGNFALEVVEKCKKLYLLESDERWIEALTHTFKPYKDKVEIINAKVGDGLDNTITLDSLVENEKIDFIKMDIEGAEPAALRGAINCLNNNNVKLNVCAYHNQNDYYEIKNILEQIGYRVFHTKGYMMFMTGEMIGKDEIKPFVRGIAIACKENKQRV